MQALLILLLSPLCMFALTSCNSGSSNSTVLPKYLPPGTYINAEFTASCSNDMNSEVILDTFSSRILNVGNDGNVFDPLTTPKTLLGTLNYAYSTCFTTQNISASTNDLSNLSVTFQNCYYDSKTNMLTFTEIIVGTTHGTTMTCSGPSLLAP